MKRQHNSLSSVILRAVYDTTVLRECCQKPVLCAQKGGSLYDIYRFDSVRLQKLIADRIEYSEFNRINHINTYINSINRNSNEVDFFELILDFADKLIVRADGRYCFRYEYTDIWIDTVRSLGQELFVTTKAVLDDLRCAFDNPRLDWQYCIDHNNYEIKKILSRDEGVSENHFHLRSSSPYFDISWIYLMNNVESAHYRKSVEKIQSELLDPNSNYISDYSLVTVWRKAAALRKILFNFIVGNTGHESDISTDFNQNKANIGQLTDWYSESWYQIANYILSCDSLDNETLFVTDIQKYIAAFSNNGCIDYASIRPASDTYLDFISGERYILYNCMKKIILKERGYQQLSTYLYLYIMMKHRFYREMVQCNRRIGFHNFNEYQDRKGMFIPWKVEKSVASETVYSVLESAKMHAFEMRIYPAEDVKSLSEDLRLYQNAVSEAIQRLERRQGKTLYSKNLPCFFTLHFIKSAQTDCEEKNCKYCMLRNNARHSVLRARLKKQTNAIMSLDKKLFNDVIKGIDAAGEEIKCRPEVFAVYFRRLLYYFRPTPNGDREIQLRATYHAGEDNYDLLDGIRAIFEAIFFLDLRSGCRLGHATLLGNSPCQYYSTDRNPIAIPAQIFLDNIVWMYYFIKENAIVFEGIELLFEYIRHNYNVYFNKIYGKVLKYINNQNNAGNNIDSNNSRYDIDAYYLSYLLRGDAPELYRKPEQYILDDAPVLSFAEEYKVCNAHSRMGEARKSSCAKHLYYLYQYSCDVKKSGEESVCEKLPDYFIRAIELVQQEMRRKITYRGIGIETNPTSNLLISNFKSMEEHPISVFYDYMLLNDSSKVQMNVSINTDDKSIFSTSLTNEYAYLAYYLEHKKNINGEYAYSRFNIMQWLNNIRIMGNEQSFIDK